MVDMVIRIVIALIFSVICLSVTDFTQNLPLPLNYHNTILNIWNEPVRRPENLVCWNGPTPEDSICKLLYHSRFWCSDDYCATMVPKGTKPDTSPCISFMSEAPIGFIIDKDYGTCAPNPNTQYTYIIYVLTFCLIFNILLGDIQWITG